MSYKDLSWISAPVTEHGNLYASVLRRFMAFMIDNLIITIIATIISPYFDFLGLSGKSDFDYVPSGYSGFFPAAVTSPFIFIVIWLVLAFFYHVFLVASPMQATIGKWLLGIYVGTPLGNRISLAHSLVRFLCYIFSAIPFGVGFIIALFNPQRIALQDLVAETRVFDGVPGNMAQTIQGDYIDQMTKAKLAGRKEKKQPRKSSNTNW